MTGRAWCTGFLWRNNLAKRRGTSAFATANSLRKIAHANICFTALLHYQRELKGWQLERLPRGRHSAHGDGDRGSAGRRDDGRGSEGRRSDVGTSTAATRRMND